MVVAHVGLPALWIKLRRPSSNEHIDSCLEHSAGLFCAKKIDRRRLAQFDCRTAIRIASIAGGIGGMDFRTQGCLKWNVLDADVMGLCKIRRSIKIRRSKIQNIL